MKKTKIFLLSIFAAALLLSCSNPTNTPSGSSSSNSGAGQTPEDLPKDYSRKNCSIALPTSCNASTNLTLNISQITLINCYSNDTYKVEITSNPSNIQLQLNEFSFNEKTIRLFSATGGTIGIKLVNETAKVNSNICTVTFQAPTTTSPGNDNGGNNDNGQGSGSGSNGTGEQNQGNPTAAAFAGTWKTNYTQGLIDTITFNSNGTGSYLNSNYSNAGSDTFQWSIANSTTLNLTDKLGNHSVCSYSFTGTSLILTNFFGLPQNTQITFNRL